MAQEQGTVYIPGKGVVPMAEAQRLIALDKQAREKSGQGGQGGPTLFSAGSAGPEVKINLDQTAGAQVLDQVGGDISRSAPMLAGLANLHPALRGVKMSFGIPSIVEGLRQALTGEEMDPVRMGFEGVLGTGATMVGGAARIPGRIGKSLIGRTIAKNEGAAASNQVVNTALTEGASLHPDKLAALTSRYDDMFKQFMSNPAKNAIDNADEWTRMVRLRDLIDRLEAVKVNRGGALPHAALRPGGTYGTLGLPEPPPTAAVDIGRTLGGGAASEYIPGAIEGALRALIAYTQGVTPVVKQGQ